MHELLDGSDDMYVVYGCCQVTVLTRAAALGVREIDCNCGGPERTCLSSAKRGYWVYKVGDLSL